MSSQTLRNKIGDVKPIEAVDLPTENPALPHWPAPIDLDILAQSDPAPPRFIVDDWLPAGYATLLSGHGGAGKSAVALNLAVCIALGLPWMGIPVQRRRVLFLSCEDRVDILHWRLARICEKLGINLSDLAGHLDILDLVSRDTVLWTPHVTKDRTDRPAYAALCDAMTTTGAAVLMLDGISDTYGGLENARAEVRAFIASVLALIDPIIGALLLIGHVDKVSAGAGSTGAGYSGSTAWHNSVRARWYLYPESRSDGETTERTGDLILEQQKSNLGRAGRRIRLTWDDDASLFIGKAICTDTTLDRAARDRRERASILAAMQAVATAGDYVPAASTGNRTAYHVLAARPEFDLERMPDSGNGRRRFRRQIEALRSMGEICESSIQRRNRHVTAVLVLPGSDTEACADAPNE